jgi:predicted PurR-regulated permease PerM
MTKSHIGELVFFWILFATVGYLAFSVISPYVVSLFLAVVFGIVFAPVHRRFRKLFPAHEDLSALFTVLFALIVVLIPVIYLGVIMSKEVLTLYGSLTEPGGSLSMGIDQYVSGFEVYMQKFIPGFQLHTNIASYLESILRFVVDNLNTFFSSLVAFLLEVFIIVIAMFFLYRDGRKLHDFAVKWSPLADNYDETILGKLEVAVTSVVKGSLITAIIQGALVGIGFVIFGVSNPVLFSVVATIAALIPLVGTGMIMLPGAAFLFVGHHVVAAIGLSLWWVVSVGVVEHITKPLLMRRDIDVHPFLILLSVLGGIVYFGPVGFLAGPIVLAFFFALLDIYPAIVSGRTIKEEPEVKGVLD